MVDVNTDLLIVGFFGKIGAGKSTACTLAWREFDAWVVSVVDPLKELAGHAYDLSDDQLYGNFVAKEAVDPRYGVSPRELLRRLGDAARLVMGEKVFIEPTLRRIDDRYNRSTRGSCPDDKVMVVVDSLRYPSEIEALKNLEKEHKLLAENVEVRIVKLVPMNRAVTSTDHESEDVVDFVPDELVDAVFANDHTAGPGVLEGLLRQWLTTECAGWRP